MCIFRNFIVIGQYRRKTNCTAGNCLGKITYQLYYLTINPSNIRKLQGIDLYNYINNMITILLAYEFCNMIS